MGPRSIDRGNMIPTDHAHYTPWLQWGRDQLIAETSERNENDAPPKSASMGPRSIDRGNGKHESEKSSYYNRFNGAAIN